MMTTTDDDLSIAVEAHAPGRPRFGRLTPALFFGLIGLAGLWWLRGVVGAHMHVHGPNMVILAAQPFAIKLHLATVLAAFAIGCVLMVGVKGTGLHRALGWSWVILMTTTAFVSFFIHDLNPHGFSPIHALSAWVVVAAPFGLFLARRHQVAAHRRMMTGLFLFGLLVAGAFTFIPGRLMFALFFG